MEITRSKDRAVRKVWQLMQFPRIEISSSNFIKSKATDSTVAGKFVTDFALCSFSLYVADHNVLPIREYNKIIPVYRVGWRTIKRLMHQ